MLYISFYCVFFSSSKRYWKNIYYYISWINIFRLFMLDTHLHIHSIHSICSFSTLLNSVWRRVSRTVALFCVWIFLFFAVRKRQEQIFFLYFIFHTSNTFTISHYFLIPVKIQTKNITHFGIFYVSLVFVYRLEIVAQIRLHYILWVQHFGNILTGKRAKSIVNWIIFTFSILINLIKYACMCSCINAQWIRFF